MSNLSITLLLILFSTISHAQQQLISHWVPSSLNESLIGTDDTDYGLLDETNAQDVFHVSFHENEIQKAELLGVITRKEKYNQCLIEKIKAEEIIVLETSTIEVETYPIQLKLLEDKNGESIYATCFTLAYDIPDEFELLNEWNSTESELIHNLIYYEIQSPELSTILNIVEFMFKRLERNAELIWNTSSSISSTTQIKDLAVILYPNPTSDYIKFQTPNNTNMNIIIYNHQGKQMIKKINHDLSENINVNSLSKGNYFMVMQAQSQTIKKQVVVLR